MTLFLGRVGAGASLLARADDRPGPGRAAPRDTLNIKRSERRRRGLVGPLDVPGPPSRVRAPPGLPPPTRSRPRPAAPAARAPTPTPAAPAHRRGPRARLAHAAPGWSPLSVQRTYGTRVGNAFGQPTRNHEVAAAPPRPSGPLPVVAASVRPWRATFSGTDPNTPPHDVRTRHALHKQEKEKNTVPKRGVRALRRPPPRPGRPDTRGLGVEDPGVGLVAPAAPEPPRVPRRARVGRARVGVRPQVLGRPLPPPHAARPWVARVPAALARARRRPLARDPGPLRPRRLVPFLASSGSTPGRVLQVGVPVEESVGSDRFCSLTGEGGQVNDHGSWPVSHSGTLCQVNNLT